MRRIHLGDQLSIGERAKRNLGGHFRFEVPRFGGECVCCNAEAGNRTRIYDPSADRTHASTFAVPVCETCDRHALRSPVARTWQRALVFGGACALGLGLMIRSEHKDARLVLGALAGGGTMVALAILWFVAGSVRRRLGRKGGHHPGLTVTVNRGCTVVTTANERLAARLLDRHRGARMAGAQLPRARAVRRHDEA